MKKKNPLHDESGKIGKVLFQNNALMMRFETDDGNLVACERTSIGKTRAQNYEIEPYNQGKKR
jgi:hypothetical protein